MRKIDFFSLVILLAVMLASSVNAEDDTLRVKLDSMFVIASSGDFKFREMVDPTIEDMGALGEVAVPYLIEKMDTKDAREFNTIRLIFEKIGNPAVPLLNEALIDADSAQTARVAAILYYLPDKSSVENLMKVSDHNYYKVRYNIVKALGKIEDLRAKPVIEKALADSNELVRTMAVVAAGRLGAKDFYNGLERALSDGYYGVRMAALEELKEFDCDARRTLLVPSLKKTKSKIARRLILSILAESFCAYDPDTFKPFMIHRDPMVRALALKAAYHVNPDSIYDYLSNLPAAVDDFFLNQTITEIKSIHEKTTSANP